jgi:hypothetical protein
MNKVPTAEEFLKKNIDYVLEKDAKQDVVQAMIEFAKLHVEAQRDDILKKVSLTDFAQEFLQEGASDAIDEESIINAYPLENIK